MLVNQQLNGYIKIKNMLNKYWFIEYNIHSDLWNKTPKYHQCVSDTHPFEWLKFLRQISSFERTLINWREITESEYKTGKEIFGIG